MQYTIYLYTYTYDLFLSAGAHKTADSFYVCNAQVSVMNIPQAYKHPSHLSDVLWGSTKYFCTSCSSAGSALATSWAAKACVVAALRLPKTISATKMHL